MSNFQWKNRRQIKTTDKSATWTPQNSGVFTTLFDVDFKDSLYGVASERDGSRLSPDFTFIGEKFLIFLYEVQ